jgi:RimJ/RimL family protein N-acetyltransferase
MSMAVLPSHRRQGIGRRLIKAILWYAFEHCDSLTRVELEVFGRNEPAIAMFCELGFVEEGRRRQAQLEDDLYDDGVLMAILKDEYQTGCLRGWCVGR